MLSVRWWGPGQRDPTAFPLLLCLHTWWKVASLKSWETPSPGQRQGKSLLGFRFGIDHWNCQTLDRTTEATLGYSSVRHSVWDIKDYESLVRAECKNVKKTLLLVRKSERTGTFESYHWWPHCLGFWSKWFLGILDENQHVFPMLKSMSLPVTKEALMTVPLFLLATPTQASLMPDL